MSIVSSTHVEGPAQVDGRHYVTETHTDHLGEAYTLEYLAPVGADYVAIRTARAVSLEAQLAEAEADALLN
jgi:hypothetical protein